MKILVLSDSHGDVDTMREVVKAEGPELIMHLGDHARDAAALRQAFASVEMLHVIGNTDGRDEGPEMATEQIMGHKMLLTHGHLLGLNRDRIEVEPLFFRCAEAGAKILLFGHAHRAFAYCREGIWLLNPGRIGKKSSRAVYATYGVLTLSEDGIDWRLTRA